MPIHIDGSGSITGVTSFADPYDVDDIVELTQAQYDALTTPEPRTMYLIVG